MNCGHSASSCGFRTSLACRVWPRRRRRSRCLRTRRGIGGHRTFRRPLGRGVLQSWGRFRMCEVFAQIRLAANAQTRTSGATWSCMLPTFYFSVFSTVVISLLLPISGCSSKPSGDTLVMIIESSPTNLDPRVGIDAQSERIDELIFDALLTRDEHLSVQPGLAERWDVPDPLTYIFHLHAGVRFHDGRPLTSRDVKWTFDSLRNGTIRSAKTSTYRFVDRIDAPDD